MKKSCLHCGAAFAGRTDKKFCSDQCRSAWHNRRTFDDQAAVRHVNRVLLHNRRLLLAVLARHPSRISLRELRSRGFAFSFFTHQKPSRHGTLTYCYETGYRIAGRSVRVFRDHRLPATDHENIWKQHPETLLLRSNPYPL